MTEPYLSIIIPTYNRPQLLQRAVQSALAQTFEDLEIVVVDDGSPKPVSLIPHPRLRVIHHSENRGTAATRNTGAKAARGRYICYLDDDDQLLPHMAEVSIKALQDCDLPPPVAVLSGLEVVDQSGRVVSTRLPPTLPRGAYFFLEEVEPGKSFISKQTLIVERKLLLDIGGYDENLQSRVHTEMFLRLNPVCSILGIPTITYRLMSHSGLRISRNPDLRQISFRYLIEKHKPVFVAHPKKFAEFMYQHAIRSYQMGQVPAALIYFLRAWQRHPIHISGILYHKLLSHPVFTKPE